ncbi:hypothetical protein ACFQ3Z_41160 [Streptomyces nogalater]
MPRRPRLTGAATAALALGLVAAAPATGTEPPVGDARVVTRFDPAAGQRPENIALEPDGSADLTFAFARTVARVAPDGTRTTRAELPAVARPDTPLVRGAVVTGIARAHDGTLYVNYATGTRATGVWRISPAAPRCRSPRCRPTDSPTAWPSTGTGACSTPPTRRAAPSGASPPRAAGSPPGPAGRSCGRRAPGPSAPTASSSTAAPCGCRTPPGGRCCASPSARTAPPGHRKSGRGGSTASTTSPSPAPAEPSWPR